MCQDIDYHVVNPRKVNSTQRSLIKVLHLKLKLLTTLLVHFWNYKLSCTNFFMTCPTAWWIPALCFENTSLVISSHSETKCDCEYMWFHAHIKRRLFNTECLIQVVNTYLQSLASWMDLHPSTSPWGQPALSALLPFSGLFHHREVCPPLGSSVSKELE